MNEMVSYERALDILAHHNVSTLIREQTVSVAITQSSGCFLGEDIVADRDFPPFDRVSMDGIALQMEAIVMPGQREFIIENVAAAGAQQTKLKEKNNCIEVMTGAILPLNTDTIVPYEDLQIEDGKASLRVENPEVGQYIHKKGIDIRQGEIILFKGRQISSTEINILAAVGKSIVKVLKFPRTVVVSTGDELVAIDQKPNVFQIRRSNVYGLQSILSRWGISADLVHLKDNKQEMLTSVANLLENYQALIFTGGVSKGKFDYLPDVLRELQVEKLFYKIKQRPGKPFWFGKSADQRNYIFALPGNPVSSFVCLWVYFRHWLFSSPVILERYTPYHSYVVLKNDIEFTPDLTYFLEAKITSMPDGVLAAEGKQGHGSGDFVNLTLADGFLILPREKSSFKKGEVYPFIFYRDHK